MYFTNGCFLRKSQLRVPRSVLAFYSCTMSMVLTLCLISFLKVENFGFNFCWDFSSTYYRQHLFSCHVISSTCRITNLPFCQLEFHQLAISSISHFINLWFHQLVISSTCDFINLLTYPFVSWHFIQLVKSSTWHLFWCRVISSTYHFVNWHFINLPFHLFHILLICHFINLSFHQLDISSTCHFINLQFW